MIADFSFPAGTVLGVPSKDNMVGIPIWIRWRWKIQFLILCRLHFVLTAISCVHQWALCCFFPFRHCSSHMGHRSNHTSLRNHSKTLRFFSCCLVRMILFVRDGSTASPPELNGQSYCCVISWRFIGHCCTPKQWHRRRVETHPEICPCAERCGRVTGLRKRDLPERWWLRKQNKRVGLQMWIHKCTQSIHFLHRCISKA